MDPSLSESDSSSHAIVIPAPTATGARRRHLHAVDLMRILAVTGVIAVHSITLVDTTVNPIAGSALMVLHTSRAIFLTVMALVLGYTYRDSLLLAGRAWSPTVRFWRRRYLLVLVPYVVWSGIYFLADEAPLQPISGAIRIFSLDLLTGAARYHLYFLLVTMQLYLIFPLLLALVRRTRGYHWLLFVLALAYQLVFSQAHHAGWPLPGILGFWLQNPDSLLPSYVLYVVAGALLADHLDQVLRLIRRWWPIAIMISIAGSVLALAVYGYQYQINQQVPLEAAEVFQPAITIESLTAILGLLTLGVGWETLLRPRWLRALISDGAESSFGIFLAHPLVLQAVVVVLTSLGVLGAITSLRYRDAVVAALLLVTPGVLTITWAIVFVLRRSPLSMPLTGRRRTRRPAAGPHARSALRVGSALTAGVGAIAVVSLVAVSLMAVDLPAQRVLASAGLPDPTRTARPQPTPSKIPAPPPGAQEHSVTVTSSGLQRTYQVLEPADPDSSSLPVIVFLQGLDASIPEEEERDGLTAYVTQGRAILVYPVAENEQWNTGEDTVSAAKVDDMAFLTTVLKQAARLPEANAHRVYLTGFSRGGKMAWELACADPSLIDGLAIVAATPVTPCATPGPPLSLLQMAGTHDWEVPYTTVPPEVAAWAQKNGCSLSPGNGNGSPRLTTYSGCTNGTKVVLATYEGGTHVWPSGDGAERPGPIIWNFFSSPG